jgi:hypothetical protein
MTDQAGGGWKMAGLRLIDREASSPIVFPDGETISSGSEALTAPQ